MAQAGHLPAFLAVENHTLHRPLAAICAVSVASYAVMYAMYIVLNRNVDVIGAVMIAICLYYSIIAYALQFVAFLHLRWVTPDATRILRSPLGTCGAFLGLALCAVSFAAILHLPSVEGDAYF